MGAVSAIKQFAFGNGPFKQVNRSTFYNHTKTRPYATVASVLVEFPAMQQRFEAHFGVGQTVPMEVDPALSGPPPLVSEPAAMEVDDYGDDSGDISRDSMDVERDNDNDYETEDEANEADVTENDATNNATSEPTAPPAAPEPEPQPTSPNDRLAAAYRLLIQPLHSIKDKCTVYHKSYNAEEMLNFVLVCGKHIFLGLVTKSVQNIWWNFSEMTRIAMSTVVQVDNDSIASLAKLSNETIKSVAAVFRTLSTFPFERAINRYGRLIRPGPHDDIVPRLVARIVKHVDDVVPYVAGREFGVLTRCPVTPEKVDNIVTSVLTRENRGSPVTVFTAALRRAQLQGQVHAFKTLKMSLWGSRSVSLAKVGCEAVLQIGPVFAKPAMFWRVEQTIYVEIEVYYRPTGFDKLSVLEIQTVLDKYAEVSGLSESEIAKAIWAAMSLEVYQFARMENISENLPPSELMASLWAMQEWESRKVTAAPPQPQLQPSYKAPFYGQRAAQPKQPSQPQKQQTSVVAAVAFAEAMAAKYNLSAEELERRRREHLCFRCGSGTHLRKTCGQAPAVAAVQGEAAQGKAQPDSP
ncbi:hypothetical protein CAOG_008927 [Capsaspora owczarzaki ATCC 30864]|uniref:Uncharacterized protein n=1 Tax=Capsaspora owczarzaki (strain ATCC 30864) TaxID=595528 RepID=A0A0D2X470_CAPO3|nr:hypothetical protein CAOG_008927 [Capsaspora owczarzaki ATCC 30864]